MSLIPTTLTLFVSTACAEHPDHLPGLLKWSIGIFYDSSRWSKFNWSEVLPKEFSPTHDLAFHFAIRMAVELAPRHYNLIIETDDAINAERLRSLILCHDEEPLKRLDLPVEDWSAHRTIEGIDARTKRGGCWVDVVYSGSDATAQTGFKAAHDLACSALADGHARQGTDSAQ